MNLADHPVATAFRLSLAGLLIALVAYAAQGTSPAFAQPELRIVKSAAGLHQGGPNDGAREYRIMARNQGDPIPAGATVTIVDDLDDALVVLAIHNVNPSWNCVPSAGNVLTCTLNAGAQLPSQDVDIVFFDVCDTIVRGSVENDAEIRLNNAFQDGDTANPNVFDCAGPNLAIDKTGPASVPEGTSPAGSPDYTIVVRNNGQSPTSGQVTVVDNLPNGLTTVSASGTGWDCDPGAGTTFTTAGPTSNISFTCTRADALAGGQSYPPINVDFTAPNDVCSPIINVASASGGGDTGENPDATDSVETLVTGCTAPFPNLTLNKTGPASVPEGTSPAGTADYTIVVGNNGNAPTTAPVTVTDNLPNGLTGVTASGTGWDCDPGGPGTTFTTAGPTNNTSFTCTRSDPLTNGQSYPAINVDFTAPNDNCATIRNTASVSGGGDTGTDPDATDFVDTQVTGCVAPNLTIDKTGPNTLPEGTSSSYSIVVGNNGTGPTSGTVTVTDDLPNGLTNVQVGGTGWDCNPGMGTTLTIPGPTSSTSFTCTRPDALAAGQSYPAITVSFTAPDGECGSLDNFASVSGGGDTGTDPDAFDTVITDLLCGSITIIKDTDPEGASQSFHFNGNSLGGFNLVDDGSITFPNLPSGNYVITEDVPDGWDLTNITCSGGQVNVNIPSVTIPLQPAQEIVCTFNNKKEGEDEDEDDDDRPIPTRTPTPTPTPSPTPTPTVTPTPGFFEQRGSAGGAVILNRPDRTPVVQLVQPSMIQPPRTGDGALAEQGSTFGKATMIAALAFSFGLSLAIAMKAMRRGR